jgi:amicyanin
MNLNSCRWLMLGLLALVPIASGCADRSVPAAAAMKPDMAKPTVATAANKVVIDNFTYSPAELTVPVGAKVTWTNRDDVPHTVTSPKKPRLLDSGTLDTDQSFSHVFTEPGTYEYFCTVHPKMTGKVIAK